MDVISTDWGIAYRYGNTIEINPILKKYPKIYEKVLEHEIGHTSNKPIDFMHDLKNKSIGFLDSMKLLIKHPKMAIQSMMPIWYHKGEWNCNAFLILSYSFILIINIGCVYLIANII